MSKSTHKIQTVLDLVFPPPTPPEPEPVIWLTPRSGVGVVVNPSEKMCGRTAVHIQLGGRIDYADAYQLGEFFMALSERILANDPKGPF